MNKFLSAVMVWMLAHPIIEHLLQNLALVIVVTTYGVIKAGLIDSHTGIAWGTLSTALAMALSAWYGLNKTLILAQIQDVVLGGTPAVNGVTTTPPTRSAALTPAAKMLFLFLFLGLATSTFANPLTGIGIVPAGGEDDVILAPVGSVEFNPSTSNNYGLALTECLAFAHVLPGSDASHVVISPYVFGGIFAAANIGQWAATSGNAPWSIDYGLMVGLPKLDESIPEVAFAASWNTINRGDAKLMINVAFPADILSSVLVHKF